MMTLYTISTAKFSDTWIKFPFIENRLFKAGDLWIELWLSEEEKDSINLMFPNRIYLYPKE